MTTLINASTSSGLVMSGDTSGLIKVQSNGVTTNAIAWVNFNGSLSTPITPRANYNVGSVTKNGTGDYTVNFTSALADANYAAVGGYNNNGAAANNLVISPTSTSALAVKTWYNGSQVDITQIQIAVFGN